MYSTLIKIGSFTSIQVNQYKFEGCVAVLDVVRIDNVQRANKLIPVDRKYIFQTLVGGKLHQCMPIASVQVGSINVGSCTFRSFCSIGNVNKKQVITTY